MDLALCDQLNLMEFASNRSRPNMTMPLLIIVGAGFVFALVTMPIVHFLVEDDDLKRKACIVYDLTSLAGAVLGGLWVAVSVGVAAIDYFGSVLGGGGWSGPASYRSFNAFSALALGMLVIGIIVGFVSSKIRPADRVREPSRVHTPEETGPDGLTKLNLLGGETKVDAVSARADECKDD